MLNLELSSDPAIVLLGIYPKELKDYVHTKIYTQMFIALSIAGKKKRNTQMSINQRMDKQKAI